MLPIYKTPLHVFNYDEIPEGYYYHVMQNGAATQRYWHRNKFLTVAKKVKEGERVLDIGCGPGSFFSVLMEEHKNIQAVGVDVASTQIKFAAKEVGSKYPDRIQFIEYDPSKPTLPFETGLFDVVTCIEVIEHLHPYLAYKLLEDAKRVLKPNGRIILTTPNYRSLWPFIEMMLEMFSPVKYHGQHINKFTPNSLVKFMESVGFEVTNFETLFIVAPFLAGFSHGLAQAVSNLEKSSKIRLGSLLVLEAKVSQL